MRVLIVILLILGGGAAFFYATHADRSARHRSAPQLSDLGRDAADADPRGESDYARLGTDDPAVSPSPPEDGTPPLAPVPSGRAEDPAGRTEPMQAGSPIESESEQSKAQIEALRQSFAITLLHQRNEIRKVSVGLATARDALQLALKERGDLAKQVLNLDSETARLRGSAQAQKDELDAVRRGVAGQAAFAGGSARADFQNQIASLQNRTKDAVAAQQETQARLAGSEALTEQLKSKLAELDATSQKTASQARGQLAEKDAATNQRDASIAASSQRLRATETMVRGLTSDRDALIVQLTRVFARQRLSATGLWAARLALASADTRAEAEHRAADLASDRARKLADGNEGLRKRAEATDKQIGEIKDALTRATTAAAATKAQSQSLQVEKDRANADLAGARADNTRLATRLETDSSELQKKLLALRQRNASLAGQAGRLPQLSRDVDDGRKQIGTLEKTVAALKAQSGAQVARINALTRTSGSEQASHNAAAAKNIAGLAETTEKLRLAEATIRDLTAGRDAAIAQNASTIAQRRLATNGLSAARVALAAAATKQLALKADSARHGKAEAELIGAKAENARLAARLGDVAAASETKLADLRAKNAALAGQLDRLPQLAQDIHEGKTQLSALEKMVAALKSANGGQLARIDALKSEQKNKEEALLSQAETDRLTTKAAADEKAQKLKSALASVREELARAVRDKGSASDASASMTKLARTHKQSASLPDNVAKAECSTKPAGAGLRADECGTDRKDTTSRQALLAARPTPAQADAASDRGSARPHLPDGVVAHVLLRYAHDGTRSQVRAQALQATLRTLGVEVNASNATGTGKPGDSVTYFYAQDRSIADQVAQRIEAPAPIRSRANSKAPRPGTIEVSIGG